MASNGDIVPFGNKDDWIDPDSRPPIEGCKLCRSKNRQEAEEKYDTTGNMARVHQFLQGKGEDLSYSAVRNHLLYHYLAVVNNSLVREYANQVHKWVSLQTDQRQGLRRAMAMLEREMHTLSAQCEGSDMESRCKVVDTINKLASTLLGYRKQLDAMDSTQEPVTIVFNQLQVIMEEEIKLSKNVEVKRAMANIFDRLQGEVGDMMVEVKD